MKFLRFTSSCSAFGADHDAGEVIPLADLEKFPADLAVVTGAKLAEVIERVPAGKPALTAETHVPPPDTPATPQNPPETQETPKNAVSAKKRKKK